MLKQPPFRHIYIVDRKKEFIVTAGGGNIAQQLIENELKLDKKISQVFVFGDRQPYLIALITPALERLIVLAHQEKLNSFERQALVTNGKGPGFFEERVAAVHAKLTAHETVKQFILLPRDFALEGSEFTATLNPSAKS